MDGITADDLKEQFQRHEGLLENLTLSIGREQFQRYEGLLENLTLSIGRDKKSIDQKFKKLMCVSILCTALGRRS